MARQGRCDLRRAAAHLPRAGGRGAAGGRSAAGERCRAGQPGRLPDAEPARDAHRALRGPARRRGARRRVNARLTADEVAYILRHSGAKIVVVDAALLPTAAAAAKDVEAVAELVVAEDAELEPDGADLSGEPRLVSYSEFLARGTQEPLPWSISDELAPIAVNYTSGTTGRPRGVIYTHRGAYLNCFGEIIHSAATRTASTCGHCRCSTATAGARPGR